MEQKQRSQIQNEGSHTTHVWYICLYIYYKNQPNVGKYTIHGSYGVVGSHAIDF